MRYRVNGLFFDRLAQTLVGAIAPYISQTSLSIFNFFYPQAICPSTGITVTLSDLNRAVMVSSSHSSPKIVYTIFGDECDELTMTARFKSLKVTVIPVDGQIACG